MLFRSEATAWAMPESNMAIATWPVTASSNDSSVPSHALSIQMARSLPSAPHPAFGAQPDSGVALRLCFISGPRPAMANDAARRLARGDTGEEPLSLEVFSLIAHLAH